MSKKIDEIKKYGGIWSFIFHKAFLNKWCQAWAHAIAVDEERKIVHFIQNNKIEIEISFAECWSEREFWDALDLNNDIAIDFFQRLLYGMRISVDDYRMIKENSIPIEMLTSPTPEERFFQATNLVLNKIKV